MKEVTECLNEMTIEEKAALLSGTEFWKTNPIPRLDIPSIYMTDGPCGLRKQGDKADHLGINQSEECTSFPTGATIASSWNTNNVKRMAQAIAEECHHYGVNILLGPAVNIKKNPRCGRNFEYYSEDPYLSGVMGSEFVKGVQGKGIGVSVKHFAVNNNENYRFMGDSIVDERALREIYLKAFERIVKEANPTSLMSAYNKLNGQYCAENEYLLMDILRDEWGYDGLVLSDWGGVSDRVKSVKASMSLDMPGDCVEFRKNIIEAIKKGTLSEEILDREVGRVLQLIDRTRNIDKGRPFNKQLHSKLSGEIAADCAVLMKNDGSLPLDNIKTYLIIGDLFDKMRYQGAGSSIINPTEVTTPKNSFDARKIKYEFVRGYRESEIEPEIKYEEEALEACMKYDEILFFGGQTDYTESEGFDRDHLLLPPNQVSLLTQLIKKGKKIIFVLFGGSPVELPFEEQISSILNMYLPGQSGGEATAALLFGEVNPSGKLAETWPISYQDVPFADDYVQSRFELYKDSIYVGYRYYDMVNGKGIRYPFGYGLSYTKFEYSNINVKNENSRIIVTCDVKNVGEKDGAEVVQLYVRNPKSDVFKADKELRGFTKLYLKVGETKQAVMTFHKNDLSYYNVQEKKWVLENGRYEIIIGASSRDLRLSEVLNVANEVEVRNPYSKEEIKEYYEAYNLTNVSNQTFEKLLNRRLPNLNPSEIPVHLESRFTEFQYSFLGRILYNAIVGVGKRQLKKALKKPDSPERDVEKKNAMFLIRLMPNNSVRSLAASSAGAFSFNMAKGFVELANGHIIKGLRYILKKEKIVPLPKKETTK
jgi:beta-glucosidase